MKPPSKSIFFRYFAYSAILVFLSFLILGVALIFSASSIIVEEYRATQLKASDEAAALLSGALSGGERALSQELGQAMRSIAAVAQCEAALADARGNVFFSTWRGGALAEGSVLDADTMAAASEGGWLPYGIPRDPEQRYETFSRVLPEDGRARDSVAAIILITGDRRPTGTLIAAFLRVYMTTAALVMLIAFGTAYINSRALARPLHEMAACARTFGRGDFSSRATRWILRDDEIGELAASFNGMADAIQKSEELRRNFISGVSHELKTPMTTISGYIGGLLDGTIPPERGEEILTIVRDEIMRLSRLVTGMLDLSRHQSGQMDLNLRPTDIAELSTRILFGLESMINQKNIAVEVLVPEDALTVTADPDGMAQVMTNLLDNAVKFCNVGGKISLNVTRRNGRAYVAVRNTGQTIPPEDIPYIFDRFHKGDRSRSIDPSGLGLGLYLVRSILNAHSEDIFVISENGLTEFMFSMPESREERRRGSGE
ncbi:MAG: HAMP domain-containing histidine kinase [Oscillospiraceae bacterium]|jgi:signal transduction histidine kinase|nr:HAMP domain-containing histidine kinase [Oscillospiraceae bacterium]